MRRMERNGGRSGTEPQLQQGRTEENCEVVTVCSMQCVVCFVYWMCNVQCVVSRAKGVM
jgi:hypothetical protein